MHETWLISFVVYSSLLARSSRLLVDGHLMDISTGVAVVAAVAAVAVVVAVVLAAAVGAEGLHH